MIVHVRVHALVSLAASVAWLDKRREPNDKRQTDRCFFYRNCSQQSREMVPSRNTETFDKITDIDEVANGRAILFDFVSFAIFDFIFIEGLVER